MYIVNVPIQIKEGFKEQFVAGIKENASHAQNDEPGCLQSQSSMLASLYMPTPSACR